MVENALNTTQNNGKSWMVLEMSRYVINSLPSVVHFFKTEGVAIAVICSIKTEHICHIYQDCNSGQTPSITNLLCQTITGDTSWCWHVRTPGKETSKSNTNTKTQSSTNGRWLQDLVLHPLVVQHQGQTAIHRSGGRPAKSWDRCMILICVFKIDWVYSLSLFIDIGLRCWLLGMM